MVVQETRQGGILQMFCTALIYSTFNAVSVSHCVFVIQPIKAVLRRKISCPRSPSPRCLSFQLSRFDTRRRQGKAWLKQMVTFVFTLTALPGKPQKCLLGCRVTFFKRVGELRNQIVMFYFSNCTPRECRQVASFLFKIF